MDNEPPMRIGIVKPDGVHVVFDMVSKTKETINVHGKLTCWEKITGTELALLNLLGIN